MWEKYLVNCVSQEERYECEAHERAIRDYNQMIFEAKEHGIEEDRKIIVIAKNLIASGLSSDIIFKETGLSIEIIDELREQ